MSVGIIAAVARNGVIGRAGGLPWHLPDDLRQFRARTIDGTVVMGRRTWESIGRPLPRRRNIVVTGREGYAAEGAEVARSLDDALALAGGDAWVIGGARLYAAALPIVDRLVITHVDAEVEGDVRFPPFDRSRWRAVSEEAHAADERHAHPFRVVVYERAP